VRVIDCFALLDMPHRPWLAAETVKQAFHRRAAAQHPDSATGDTDAFAELNRAYTTLRDPAQRVRHLLELNFPDAVARSADAPAKLGDLFLRTGSVTQRITAFLARECQTTAPLARALLATERRALREEAALLLATLNEAEQRSLEALQMIDTEWDANGADLSSRLSTLYGALSFLSKWSQHLRERLLQLNEPTTL
jgi:hypothetical protein